jgi:hypothetical protein
MTHCKYVPQSVLGNSNCKLCYDGSVITYTTIHNYRPDTAVRDKPPKKGARAHTHTHTHIHIDVLYIAIYIFIYLFIYTAIPNSHNLPSTITQKLLQYTGLKEELFRIF